MLQNIIDVVCIIIGTCVILRFLYLYHEEIKNIKLHINLIEMHNLEDMTDIEENLKDVCLLLSELITDENSKNIKYTISKIEKEIESFNDYMQTLENERNLIKKGININEIRAKKE